MFNRKIPLPVPIGTLALSCLSYNPFELACLELRWCHVRQAKEDAKYLSFVIVIFRDGNYWQFQHAGGGPAIAAFFFGLSFIDLLLLSTRANATNERPVAGYFQDSLDYSTDFSRDTCDEHLEQTARRSLESRTARILADDEWKRVRRRLMEFYAILRRWEKEAAERQPEKDS